MLARWGVPSLLPAPLTLRTPSSLLRGGRSLLSTVFLEGKGIPVPSPPLTCTACWGRPR